VYISTPGTSFYINTILSLPIKKKKMGHFGAFSWDLAGKKIERGEKHGVFSFIWLERMWKEKLNSIRNKNSKFLLRLLFNSNFKLFFLTLFPPNQMGHQS